MKIIEIESRRSGKYFASLIQLNNSLKENYICGLVTSTPEKLKIDFKYMNDSEIKLIALTDCENGYTVELIKKQNESKKI